MASSVVDMQKKDVADKGLKLEIVRVIKASRQRVFDAWTRPEMIRAWFGPGGMAIQETVADSKVDGQYRIVMHGSMEPAGEVHTSRVEGRYVRVEPYDLLAFTWKADFDPGEETLVTVTLKDVEGGTEMTLRHEGFAAAAMRDGHSHGWSAAFEKFVPFVEKGQAA